MVSDIDLDASPSKSDASDPDEMGIGVHIISTSRLPQACTNVTITNISSNSSVAEDDELGDGLRTGPSSILSQTTQSTQNINSGPSSNVGQESVQQQPQPQSQQQQSQLARTNSLPWIPGQVERRRRKLPEIPKNRKCRLTYFYCVQ